MPTRNRYRFWSLVSPFSFALLAVVSAATQSTTTTLGRLPQYDIVSIRETGPKPDSYGALNNDPDRTTLRMTLTGLAAYAYSTGFVFGGPKWANETTYDVDARVPESEVPLLRQLGEDQRGLLIQPVLLDRFGLKVHHEMRMIPVYEMVLAKGGPRLQKPKAADAPDAFKFDGKTFPPGTMLWTGTEIRGIAVDLPTIARNLVGEAHRTVVDRTGLPGKFDFVVQVRPTWGHDSSPNGGGAQVTEEQGEDFFTAMHDQLGLDLKPAKVPMDVIVIDDAHPPTSN